eukprot:CAMPEP_0183734258 /NCGR_PEP_ID=MMETSP0737-20130205/43328_1 /TAXON_ID=385413 /ORGANISM="Thalassiosira miniscula, Strain CCMP1093" /LENGTH=298 /DNA_ID=CAMNT_0025967709 /DNA_START=20 /DNA_END=916 /DNA_ORIENTATION=-
MEDPNNPSTSSSSPSSGGTRTPDPDGFSLEHNAVPQSVWEAIRHWLTSNMLPEIPMDENDNNNNNKKEHGASSKSKSSSSLTHVPIPWETGPQMQGRKIAQFGNCHYDYIADVAKPCSSNHHRHHCPHPIPAYLKHALLDKNNHGNGTFEKSNNSQQRQYTQCIINVYEPHNEIPWHVDHPYFGPEVLVYTFGEDRPLLLRRRRKQRKLVVLSEDQQQTIKEAAAEAASLELEQCSDNNNNNNDDDDVQYCKKFECHPKHLSKYVLSGEARYDWEHSVPIGKGERVSITFRSWAGPRV